MEPVENNQSHGKNGIIRLLEISGEKKWWLVLSVVLAAASTVMQIVPYIASYKIIRIYISAGMNGTDVNGDDVFFWGLTALISVFAAMLLNGMSFILSHFAAFRIVFNTRIRLAKHLATLPLGYFTRVSSGEIHKNIHDNVDLIELFISHKIPDMVMTVSAAIVIFGMYLYVDWILGLICILVYVLSLLVQFRIYGDEGMKKEIKGYFASLESINSSAMEFARGIPVFKMFSMSVNSFASLRKSVTAYRDFAIRFAKRGARDYIIFTILVNFFIFFIYPFVIWQNAVNPGDAKIVFAVLFFTILSNAILPSLMNIMNISSVIMTINEGVERIDRIFSVKPLPVPEHPEKPAGYSVEFNDVCFAYSDDFIKSSTINVTAADRITDGDISGDEMGGMTLSNVSFKVEEGKTLAVIGRSGSGKSTILSLLSRFYDPDSGSVKIGGTDIRNMSGECLMESISFVLQKTFMFEGTIRDNISGGVTGATEEDILRAAHLAQCDDIIEKYGLDCCITGDANTLSGGEKQRINIARAILKNAPVLLLDEVSSALDAENELLLSRAISELKKNKTIIMVAHKLNTVVDADEIIMMDKGRIMARGTHEELLRNSAGYRELWDLFNNADNWRFNVKEARNG